MLGKLDAGVISLQENVWCGWWCPRKPWRTEVTRDQVNGLVTDNDGELGREGSPETI